jgi:hypothetical protein
MQSAPACSASSAARIGSGYWCRAHCAGGDVVDVHAKVDDGAGWLQEAHGSFSGL